MTEIGKGLIVQIINRKNLSKIIKIIRKLQSNQVFLNKKY